jgi:dienelactone hydrolase
MDYPSNFHLPHKKMSPQQTRISAKKSSSIPIGPKYTPAPVLQPKATKKPDRQLPEWQPEGGGMVSPLQRLLDTNAVQAKLTIGEPNDKYEQEADAVAQDVVQRLHSPVSETPPETEVQRETEAGKHQLQRKAILQRTHAVGGEPASADLEGSINRAKGGGQPLDTGLQRSMSQAMGADFSGVRVHTDSHADQLNQSIQAKAFTTGQDVFFRQGAYDPGSRGGQELIAHELTHVVQQKGTGQTKINASSNLSISAGQVSSRETVQLARGKAGRISSDLLVGLAGIPIAGIGALAGIGLSEAAARLTFGYEKDRTTIHTPTATLNSSDQKPYKAKDISIRGSRYVLRGRKYEPKTAYEGGRSQGKAVIVFSGSGGSNEDMVEPVAGFYCKQGAVVYGVNYRGYGKSRDVGLFGRESTPFMSEAGLYKDARKIYEYVNVEEGYSAGDIILHGFSLGGAVAAHLAKTLAKPVAEGGQGVQLGGLVLHSSIKSAYEAAKDDIKLPILGQIGGLINYGSAGSFDTVSRLEKLADRDPDLPIHFMSGDYNGGLNDQLALSHTQLDTTGTNKFTNVSSLSGTGDHLDGNAVPTTHFTDDIKHQLATLVARGRNRNKYNLQELQAVL